jgi:HEAT repeat protein
LLDSPGTREAAVDALDRIGPPAAAAVAPLIRRLNDPKIDELERYADVSALASIDTGSPQVLSVLLHEVVSDKGGAAKLAAVALAKPERLPPDLAPQLASAIRSLPEGDDKRALLAQALEHAR